MNQFTVTITGTIQGGLWLPFGCPAWKEFNYTFSPVPKPFQHQWEGLREALELIQSRECGDFSTETLLSQVTIKVSRIVGKKEVVTRKWWDTFFESPKLVSDLFAQEPVYPDED